MKQCSFCHSNDLHLVKYVTSNNVIQYRYQCKTCGHLDLRCLKHNSIPKNIDIPFADIEAKNSYYYNKNYSYVDNKPDHKKYITSSIWKNKKEEILKLKGNKCIICGNNEVINIHHLNYNFLGHEEENEYKDVVVLCQSCHEKLHEYLKDNKSKYSYLKFELMKLRLEFNKKYHDEINNLVYFYTKNLVKDFSNKKAMEVCISTIYGETNCLNPIFEEINTDYICKKITGGK